MVVLWGYRECIAMPLYARESGGAASALDLAIVCQEAYISPSGIGLQFLTNLSERARQIRLAQLLGSRKSSPTFQVVVMQYPLIVTLFFVSDRGPVQRIIRPGTQR